MGIIHDAKYIQVVWQNRTTAKKVTESRDSLRLEEAGENTVEVEVVSYSQIDDGSSGQFAIRLDSQAADVPSVELGDGTTVSLVPAIDPATGIRWWVEGKTWDERRGHWLSDIYRGVGEVCIRVGIQSCRVKVSASTFTHQDLKQYLADFQTGFWELILDDASYTTGGARRNRQNLLDEATLRAISAFIKSVGSVLKNPKAELREVQHLKPRKEVRPVARTFMEMSTRGGSRMLTSRAYQESLDVPENRYAHYALRKVYQITKALCIVAAGQDRSLKKSLEEHKQRLHSFSNLKLINKDAVLQDLLDKERAIVEERVRICETNTYLAELAAAHPPSRQRTAGGKLIPYLQISPGKCADKIARKPFFSKVRSSAAKLWFDCPEGGYATVELGGFAAHASAGCEYEIVGEISYKVISGPGKPRHHFELIHVSEFRLLTSKKLERLSARLTASQQQAEDLERCGWERPLSKEEAAQQKREADSLQKLIGLMASKQESLATLGRELSPKLPALRAALKMFEENKIKSGSSFPNSMSYVQNPSYRGIHSAFTKIKDQSGLNDEEILLAIDRIEEISLVNVSMLYERWCLLQIIKVLIRFRYRPEAGWKRKLISQIFDSGRNVAVDFENPDLRRKVTLHYEKELDNGKRPDFVLDVSAHWGSSEATAKKRFVMDAKFYQDINSRRHGGLQQVVNELYNGKDYSEGGKNMVFVLHPSSSSAPKRATPQEWSHDNYYGEIRAADWGSAWPNHRYGGIYLSPINNGSHLDSLQRCIGMFLQYGMEDNESAGTNGALPENGMFCLICGSSDISCKQSPKNPKAWWTICNECRHFTGYSYCASCDNRLVKNGEHWSYHAVEPLNPVNIKCPSCGDLL